MEFVRNEVFSSNVGGKDQKELSLGNNSTHWFMGERPVNTMDQKWSQGYDYNQGILSVS